MANLGTFESLLSEIGKALLPLRNAISSKDSFFAFMLKMGWQADDIPQPLQNLGSGLDTLFSELQKIVGNGLAIDGSISLESTSVSANISIDDILRLKIAVEQVVNGIHGIASAPDAAFPASLIADNFKGKFPKQLISYLIISYLTTYHSSVAFAFRALGIVKTKYIPSAGNRLPYVDCSIDLSDLPQIFESPSAILENAFGWGRDDFDFRSLASQFDNLLTSIDVDVFIEEIPRDVAAKIEGGLDIPGDPIRKAIKGVFFERARSSGKLAADIRLVYLPKNGSKKPGFALLPAFNGILDFKMQLGPDVAVIIKSNLDLQGGVALQIRPGNGIEMLLGFNNPGSPTNAKGSVSVGVERTQLDNTPILILGSKEGTRLQYRKLGGAGGISLDSKNAVDIFAEFETKGLEFIFQPSDGDGFIQKILSGLAVNIGFDLTTGISYQHAFYFRGTSSLEIEIPTHINLGPLDVQSLIITATPRSGEIPISLGANFKAGLGPLVAVVQDIGLTSTFSFPDTGGNLGPLNLALGFKPPNGVGLSLDAGVVKGGGFLYFDFNREEYAGVLELSIAEIVTVKAIGLITTKMPDGSKDFLLLIIITAEFGTGIQLGFGFTLIGLGGLLGLNRTMNRQPLMEGIRTGAINSIMFPDNPVANAPRIISDLRLIFPPYVGKFLIGPMAKLGWGTPTLVSVSLGVIIEIPGNIAILGVLKIALPAEEAPLIIIQVNFFGFIEFDKKRLYFFATLFESRVLFLTIEGDMGLLVAWGDDANFVVSVGGFHPRFNPPPLPFPSPRRIAIDILNTPVYRIRSEGYFAVTSNTVQFGSRTELMFDVGVARIDGHIAFDALFQFSPFYFIIEISAGVSLKVFGMGLFSISLQFTLEGPTPWRAHGSGSISFLFFDVSADFDVTWGDSRDTTLPPIPVMPLLKAELEKQQNWIAELPAGNNLLVSLRKLSETESSQVLHPLGILRVSQRAAPLDIRIDKVGSQKPSDANQFKLVPTGDLVKVSDADEQFAKAQFITMSDADKLSQRAFDPLHGGVKLASGAQTLGSAKLAKRKVRYEQIIIDNNFKRFRLRFKFFSFGFFTHFLQGSAITKSALSKNYRSQLDPFTEKLQVKEGVFTVALAENNCAYSTQAMKFSSETLAHQYIQEQVSLRPELHEALHVIPQHEVTVEA